MELVLVPLPLVGEVTILVVQSAEPMHLVRLPLPIVHASILVVEFALPVAQVLQLVPFVSAPLFEGLNYILHLLLLLFMFMFMFMLWLLLLFL